MDVKTFFKIFNILHIKGLITFIYKSCFFKKKTILLGKCIYIYIYILLNNILCGWNFYTEKLI